MIYEYIDNDLEKEIQAKIKTGDLFAEKFLWQLLNAMINCLEILQRTGRRYGDIRPCNVYYSKQENIMKLLYTNYAKTSFDLILAKKLPFYRCFLAPEQLEIVGEQRPNEKNLDLIKCADYIIDIGPEGGENGGKLVAFGTPEEIVKNKNSVTGIYLKEKLH